jgi:hypothetical protein
VGSLKERIRHAFAVDPPGEQEPTPEQQPAVDWFCRQLAKRNLTTPALIGLEMSRPLNYLASMTMHFFSPGVWAIMPQRTHEHYQHFAAYLERRGSIEYICRRIEMLEQEYLDQARAAKASGSSRGGDAGSTPHEPQPTDHP